MCVDMSPVEQRQVGYGWKALIEDKRDKDMEMS